MAALERFEQLTNREPLTDRGLVYALLGRKADALAIVERIERAGPQAGLNVISIYAQLGRVDEALARLETAFQRRRRHEPVALLPFVFVTPELDPLRGHPRFAALAREAGLPLLPLPPTR